MNHLWDVGDLDGLLAAYQAGTNKNVREAPYALVVIGRVLRDRGDLDGWREAWRHAIDAGFEGTDDLRDKLSPPAEDQDGDEPAGVPGTAMQARPCTGRTIMRALVRSASARNSTDGTS